MNWPGTRAALASAYDDRAELRTALTVKRWKLDVLTSFRAMLPARPRVLDVGAGTGHFAALLDEAGTEVTAVDISPRHVEMCRALGIDARVADAATDALGDSEFDGAWAMNSLLHVPKSHFLGAVENIGTALVPGGLAIICQWGGEDFDGHFDDDVHHPPRFFSLFDDDRLAGMHFDGLERESFWTLEEEITEAGHHPQILLLRRTAS